MQPISLAVQTLQMGEKPQPRQDLVVCGTETGLPVSQKPDVSNEHTQKISHLIETCFTYLFNWELTNNWNGHSKGNNTSIVLQVFFHSVPQLSHMPIRQKSNWKVEMPSFLLCFKRQNWNQQVDIVGMYLSRQREVLTVSSIQKWNGCLDYGRFQGPGELRRGPCGEHFCSEWRVGQRDLPELRFYETMAYNGQFL